MTPGAYKAGAVDEQISYTCDTTKFGPLMLAATNRGVCFAMFGESESRLLTMLKTDFPKAQIERCAKTAELKQWYKEIDQYLNSNAQMPNIPLDLRGTAFQLRVWEFLRSIAEGDVVSYSDVANGIGKPTAFRAAATACAKNRVALLVPCHRVLRGDGSIGGYRWGVDTKLELLAMEKSNSNH